MAAAVTAPVVKLGFTSVAAVVAVVVAAAAAVVAVAARKEVEAPGASAELKIPAITTRPIAFFATSGKEAAPVSTEAAAESFTAFLRRKKWRPRRRGDSTRKSIAVVSVSFAHRPRPPRQYAIEVDLSQSLQAVGGASAGDCP